MPLVEHRTRSVRDEVIRLYEARLPKGRLDPRDGIWSRDHMRKQLERLHAGQNVQLHRWGELDALPVVYRPTERTWTLYELRGDELVPVPTWVPGWPPPREWTVPVSARR
ncbi:hypothetical protein [Mycobacterium seoulense]|uniref:hypothetical protein n=1 Tax=Mycobacterium seoulense TaxID=386911 RepID=UPI003CF20E41